MTDLAPTSLPPHGEGNSPSWAIEPRGQSAALVVRGDWTIDDGAAMTFPPSQFDGQARTTAGSGLVVDTSSLGHWDSSLLSFLWTARLAARQAGLDLDLAQVPKGMQRLFTLLPAEPQPPAHPDKKPFAPLRITGAVTLDVLDEIGALTELGIETARGSVTAVSGRGGMRLRDLFVNIFDAGPSALLIVSVVNFLVGAILAFVGAVQLRKFSADIYVANLVGIACVRELSAVMTAIIMAGRTGGAYAARIATMLGNEEIDALRVFGIPISSYILLPSVLSLMLMMPLLYLYGCGMSILGGYAVATGMLPDITGAGYLNQTIGAINLQQFEFGFVKSIVFAIMVGLTSCRIGLRAGRSAADVGTAATRAVVVGIVGVISLDAIFAVIANVLDI